MSATLHKQIRDAVVTALRTAIVLADPQDVIAGRRKEAMPEQTDRQVHVYLDFSKPERGQFGGSPDDWMTRIRIECSARQQGAESGEDRADALAAACYAAVASNPGMDGLCSDMVPLGLTWDDDQADLSLGTTQVLFDAQHRTESTSIAAP